MKATRGSSVLFAAVCISKIEVWRREEPPPNGGVGGVGFVKCPQILVCFKLKYNAKMQQNIPSASYKLGHFEV